MSIRVVFFNINMYSLFDALSKAPVGGSEVQLFNVARFLSQSSGFDVSVITGDWGQKLLDKKDGIRIYRSFSIEEKIMNYLKAPFLMWRALKAVDADVYVASSAGTEIGILALFCRVYGKKFVYRTAHQIDCNRDYELNNGWRGRLYGFGLRNTSIIVTQNVEHQELLAKNGLSSIVIRNSFALNEKSVSSNKKQNILWVSRCEKWKNPDLFLDIIERFPEASFIMICPQQNHQKELFRNIADRSKFLKNLKFKERIPFSEIQRYFNDAKLFIGTSEYEGFPNTYIQACIGKTPTISYKVDPDNFITRNNLGYCANGDFERMVELVDKLLNDREDWKEKSENSFRYVKESHDVEIIGKQWSELLRRLYED